MKSFANFVEIFERKPYLGEQNFVIKLSTPH